MNEERLNKRTHWENVLNNCKDSGLTVSDFCREKEIPVWKYYYWKKRLRGSTDKEKNGVENFVQLAFRDSPDRNSGLRFELASGLRLVLESGFDANELVRVLRIVGGK